MGIIEQCGNELKLIADEFRKYPEIGLEWKEPGIAFRVIFTKLNAVLNVTEIVFSDASEKILELIKANNIITIKELSDNIGISKRSIERNLKKLQDDNKLRRVGADKGGHWEIN